MQKSTGAPWHSPDVSFRGAKRRGNLAVPWWITGRLWRKRNCLPEIATSAVGLLAMTNLGALLDRRACLQICSCHRRSMSAATDAIGAYHFIGSVYESQALRRVRLSAPLQGARSRCSSVHALEHHRVFRAEHSAPVAAFLVLRRRQIELVVLHGIVEDILPVLPALRQVEDAVRGRIGPG